MLKSRMLEVYLLYTSSTVGFEVLTAAVMNLAIFWDIVLCSPYVNRRFRGMYHPHLPPFSTLKIEVMEVKCQFTYGLHGAISQKMGTFIANQLYEADHYSRGLQLCIHSRTFQHFMEP
jgi:hypothetical protein